MSIENKQGGSEPSPASDGSVAGEPMAWALMQPDSYSVFASRRLAEKKQELCGGGGIVPLYRQPTLTDAERIAIEHGIAALLSDEEVFGWDSTPHAATLRVLIERTK